MINEHLKSWESKLLAQLEELRAEWDIADRKSNYQEALRITNEIEDVQNNLKAVYRINKWLEDN